MSVPLFDFGGTTRWPSCLDRCTRVAPA
jgi:hypothetical protein